MPAVQREIVRGAFGAALIGAFACGLALAFGLNRALPSAPAAAPYGAIAASLVVDLAALAVLLWRLPATGDAGEPWAGLRAWASSVLACGAAMLGLWCSGSGGAAPWVLFVLWLLFAGQAAVVAAGYSWLSALFGGESRLAAQVMLLAMGLAATALFWSREPIQMLSREGASGDSAAAVALADGVMKFSPPMAVASVWYQESAAGRFDIVRAPLAYDVWIGSYQAVPYPRMMPGREDSGAGTFRLGVIMGMLACGIAALLVGDMAAVWRAGVRQAG